MATKTPAQIVHALFGVRRLARELGLSPGAVCRWQDNGGRIPARHHQRLLALAKAKKRRLTPTMLIYGDAG